ncbi:putative high affinity zinc ion transporter [Aspergillus steynii IBT 23096]|uniref:Putative high affinity zinc ion transporter n=1 Tax=Aspergillus steynii IBT 23096 TaxID=1392250 RepID=A0A2I2FXF6_9EURO|nr:putative high affinity zinc ion transporter [Aspergillus steynii IBT 23096]PLB45314.1 putative high affinity zinc ion transporter [Aspergillus steynii IBT 23096]
MSSFNASHVDLNTASKEDVICYLSLSENDYNGHLGARISSIFVIFVTSTILTLFPVIAKRVPRWKIPYHVYLFARYFGTGVILATAFIHLLDPAYKRIGPKTCVGVSGRWGDYSWCAAIVLASVVTIFLLDLAAEVYVERKYGVEREDGTTNFFVTTNCHSNAGTRASKPDESQSEATSVASEQAFRQQFAAFLILEFGIIFHSVIIGLNLGVTGDEFATLYPVLVFHQAFEGLGIGARMSALHFGTRRWLPWALCLAYGLTTPVSIAIGLGVRNSYNPGSKTALIVQGVLNAVSAGILIYSSLVELLARDFLFDPERPKRRSHLGMMVGCTLLGAGIMALIGKWA